MTSLVRDVMTAAPLVLRSTDRLTDVWTLLVNKGFHHVPVVEDGALVGMVSAVDLLERLRSQDPALGDTGVIVEDIDIAAVMAREVVAIAADAPARDAVRRLSRGDIHALPVLDGGDVVGIVTSTDLARMLLDRLEPA